MITKPQTRTSKALKIAIIAVLVIGVLVAGAFFLWPKSTNQNNTTDQGQNEPTTQVKVVVLDDLTYPKLPEWSGLTKEIIDSNGAVSGLGHSNPNGLFMIKTASSTPSSAADLESGVLVELKKLSDFSLVESPDVTVNNATGKKFIYTFTDQGSKVKQEMNVVVSKQKTYFFLFSSLESDFDDQAQDFSNILVNVKFKN